FLAAAIATATAVIVSIPVIEISERAIAAIWVGDQKCGLRAVLAKSANQFCGLSSLVCSNERVLLALACFELQRLILCLQTRNLVLGQEIQNGACGCLLSVDDVAGAGLHQGACVASLGRPVIAHALDCVVDAAGLSGYSILNVL